MKQAALDYIEAVAKLMDRDLPDKEAEQTSVWMEPTGKSGSQSVDHTRKVFNKFSANALYQLGILQKDELPEQQTIVSILKEVEIRPLLYQNVAPLIFQWFDLSSPLPFDKQAVSKIVEEFADFVCDEETITQSKMVISPIVLECGSLELEKGVTIRPISDEELWSIGDRANTLLNLSSAFNFPQKDWWIIDVRVKQRYRDEIKYYPQIALNKRNDVFTVLQLIHNAHLTFLDLGGKSNYGMDAMGSAYSPSNRTMSFPFTITEVHTLKNDQCQKLKNDWPRISKVLNSDNDDLRLPALRLVDGCRRERADDSIIDYSIGLEVLLTAKQKDELRYRFLLRGATILAWDDAKEKKEYFKKLQHLYDTRSGIVHGSSVKREDLIKAYNFEEESLRKIWWWCFDKAKSLKKATELVDSRILQ